MKGKLTVNTENIFPIIKKFLYSDHDIFLRELVANATDASQKLQKLAAIGKYEGELGELDIRISIDEAAKTLTISDRGIGMTEEEVNRYINQVAFSGATEFVEKFKDADTSSIIGKFGLGFYSAFMVADRVELITQSYTGTPAVKWTSDGTVEYDIEPTERPAGRGTDVVLYINADSEEFLQQHRISEILNRYAKFMPVPIVFGTTTEKVTDAEGKEESVEKDRVINSVAPLWTKAPNTLTDEDYLKFYRELYPFSEEPLFWIHLNVDHPFNLTGILYFPKVKNDITLHKDKIQLYSRQVFITDNVEDIVPEFLRLMHGVIDSPDIPLNVSRSYLQADAQVKKISNYITRKVADRLDELFRTDRKTFEEKWESIGLFVKYGMMTDEKFFEKGKKFCLFKNLEGRFFTIEEYKEHIQANQTDKDGNSVFIYTSDPAKQDTFIQSAKRKGYDILVLDSMIDSHFTQNVEHKLEKVQLKRVDADTAERLVDSDLKLESVLTEEQQKQVVELFKQALGDEKQEVKVEAMSAEDLPVSIVRPEWMRRMEEMAEMQGGMAGMFGGMPPARTVVVNGNHPLIMDRLLKEDAEAQRKTARYLYDLALLSQGMLKGGELTDFIQRSIQKA